LASGASAKTYPDRPVTILVAFPPGGADDAIARIIQDPLQKALGLPIVVENLGGAGGMIAADRLDFTVIGPAVNLVSRIEAVAKALNLPIVVSDDFARAYGEPPHPLGRHELRRLAAPHHLFAPTSPSPRA
jgi:class 3 adenylate cyclase